MEMKDYRALALIDTGATHNFIGGDLVPIEKYDENETHHREVRLASTAASTQSRGILKVSLRIEGQPYEADCQIVPDLREEVILGQGWLRRNDAMVDLNRHCVHVGTRRRQTVRWHQAVPLSMPPEPPRHLVDHLGDPVRATYEAVLVNNAAVFDELRPPSTTPSTEHVIRFKNNAPIKMRAYRCSEARKQLINEEI